MIYVTCYFLIIGTDIKFNHANSAIHSLGHSHSLLTSASDYTSAQWRLVLHILGTCSPHVNKCWVNCAIYGIHWGRNHWPITIQHVRAQWRSVVSWRVCSTEVRRLCECPEALGMFKMDFTNICEFWSLIKTHNLLVCNIIKTMPYNGCPQMVRISLKTKKKIYRPRLMPAVRCWSWVLTWVGQPLQHGEVRDTNLAWVRPVGLFINTFNTRITLQRNGALK